MYIVRIVLYFKENSARTEPAKDLSAGCFLFSKAVKQKLLQILVEKSPEKRRPSEAHEKAHFTSEF